MARTLHENVNLSSHLKCLVALNENETILKDAIDAAQHVTLHVKCLLTSGEYSRVVDNKMSVGVFDMRDYFDGAKSIVLGREASFFDATRAKVFGLRNCACTVRNVSQKVFEDILMWTRLNRVIGVSELSLYTTHTDIEFNERLRKETDGYLKVYEYEMNVTKLCVINKFSNLTACAQRYEKFFMYGQHNFPNQVIMMNEILLNTKYKYEFVSNYDINEIIFPRNFPTMSFVSRLTAQNWMVPGDSKLCTKLQLENKVTELLKKLKEMDPNAAAFRFFNFFFLDETERSFDRIFSNDSASDDPEEIRLKSKIKSQADFEHFAKLKYTHDVADCLKEKCSSEEMRKSRSKFKAVMSRRVKRGAKLLFRTDCGTQ
jgi:hypothetical protein